MTIFHLHCSAVKTGCKNYGSMFFHVCLMFFRVCFVRCLLLQPHSSTSSMPSSPPSDGSTSEEHKALLQVVQSIIYNTACVHPHMHIDRIHIWVCTKSSMTFIQIQTFLFLPFSLFSVLMSTTKSFVGSR